MIGLYTMEFSKAKFRDRIVKAEKAPLAYVANRRYIGRS
jgi:hypothetical protein